MGKLFKRITTKIDPQTGKKITIESKKWHGRYRDADRIERRVPLAENKTIAQRMLVELEKRAEQMRAGLLHPAELEMKKPITEHLEDFKKSLKSRNNTQRYVHDTISKLKRSIDACGWKNVSQIKATDVESFLVELRDANGCSVETSNHYLRTLKSFCRWLYLHKRIIDNPLLSLSVLNNRMDRRHDRRALNNEEFRLLIQTTETAPPIEGVSGPDRAVLYILASYTGFRKGELGSLTSRSFDFGINDSNNNESPTQNKKIATITIEAAYSKHRRKDVQSLHPEIATRLKNWLSQKKPLPDELLFSISQRAGGIERKASKMIRLDLESARTFWIANSKNEEEEQYRLKKIFCSIVTTRVNLPISIA